MFYNVCFWLPTGFIDLVLMAWLMMLMIYLYLFFHIYIYIYIHSSQVYIFIFIVVKSTDSEWIPDQRYCRDKCKGNIETKNHVFSFNRSTRHLLVRFEICCHDICYMLHCKQPRVSAKLSRRKTRSIEPDFFGASLEPQRRGSFMFVPSSSTSEMSRSWLCSQENTNS